MGFKSLSLQMIPYWCSFHYLLRNHISSSSSSSSSSSTTTIRRRRRSIKLIKSDGQVKIYHKPINASDLMIEFPKHLICHSDSFYIGQKIQPLSNKDQLQLGHNYFLLPIHFFQSVLSFVTISSFASSPSLRLISSSSQPFDIRKTPSGSLQIRVSDDFISKLIEEKNIINNNNIIKDIKDEVEEEEESRRRGRICTTPQLHKDYMNLVVGSRQWKSKLETIREPTKRRKLASFGIKRRKKSLQKATQKTTHHHHHHHHHHVHPPPPPPPPSKSKSISNM